MADDAFTPMANRNQPLRPEILNHTRLNLVEHPLAETLLATLRDDRVGAARFGDAAARLAGFLIWEASRDLETEHHTVPGFTGAPVPVRRLVTCPAGVIILRAGEVFANPFRAVFPDAALYHLGIARDEKSLDHQVYSDNVPLLSVSVDRVLILDPMLATGGSIVAAIDRVRRGFDGALDVITLVSAPLGVQTVLERDQRTRVVTAAVDDRLDANGYILPGLGDAGDRFFGTR